MLICGCLTSDYYVGNAPGIAGDLCSATWALPQPNSSAQFSNMLIQWKQYRCPGK